MKRAGKGAGKGAGRGEEGGSRGAGCQRGTTTVSPHTLHGILDNEASFSIVQSVCPASDGTGLPISRLFIARTGRTTPVRPLQTLDGTKYNLHHLSNLWTRTDGGRLPRHRKSGDISGTQRDLGYLINEVTISSGSLAEAALTGCGRGASLRQSTI